MGSEEWWDTDLAFHDRPVCYSYSMKMNDFTAIDFKTNAAVKITLLGIGGAGLNTVSRLHDTLNNVNTVSICTDEQLLSKSQAKTRLLIGRETTNGRGSGGDPKIGEKAARESQAAIRGVIKNADLVFLVAGLAGGGAGACYVAAQIAKELGIITIAFLYLPFDFEGFKKVSKARQAGEKINGVVDACLFIQNDKLFQVVSQKTLMKAAYDLIYGNVEYFINSISDMINADNKSSLECIFRNAGKLFFGSGKSSKKEGPLTALTRALNNPLIDGSIAQAANIILSVKGKKISSDSVDIVVKGIKEINKTGVILHDVSIDENSDFIVSVIAV